MDTSLYVTLSSQIALERRLTTIADNVANLSTVGFRATQVKFEPLPSGAEAGDVDFVNSGEDYLSTQSGAFTETGNLFDFAIKSEAWFAIETPIGQVLTRDGRFTMTDAGDLVTLNGYPVLDAGGAPLQLDPFAGPPTAGADGVLRQDGRQAGALGLFEADLDAGFERYENSGIVPVNAPEPVVDRIDAGVVQGYVEEANVNAVAEITRLIMVSRAFESAAAATRETDRTYDEAVKVLGGGS